MIELAKITKSYAGSVVLDRVSLRVERGEIAAVVGPSGAGKSTLASCINLVAHPDSGSITVDGRDLTRLRGRELRSARHAIGTVFQGSALLRRRTASANVALPLEFLGVTAHDTAARVAELLDLVGLSEHHDTPVTNMSGGQQQRVGIARALSLRPSVLLADEATSGLDPDTTRSILQLLTRLRADLDLTVVLITHEMDVVRDVADTVHLLEQGRIVESGAVRDVLLDPDSDLAADLVPERGWAPGPGNAWRVQYVATEVPTDWLVRASTTLGVPLGLLAGTIEQVGAVTVGRAVIDVPRTVAADQVRTTLGGLGLSATPTHRNGPAAALEAIAS